MYNWIMSVKENSLKIHERVLTCVKKPLCLVRRDTDRDTDQNTQVWLSHSITCEGKNRQCSSTGRLLGI